MRQVFSLSLISLATFGSTAAPKLEDPVSPPKIPDAEQVRQAEIDSDLKALHAAATKYLVAHQGVWPQTPATLEDLNARDLWFMQQLEPHGGKPEHWVTGATSATFSKVTVSQMGYQATLFDDKTLTAYRFAGQPWFVSLAGRSKLVFPNGDVRQGPDLKNIKPEDFSSQPREAFPGATKPLPVEQLPAALQPLARELGWK